MSLKLRRLKSSDAREVALFMQDSNMKKFLGASVRDPYTLKDAERFVRRASVKFPYYSAIQYENSFVGVVSLKKQDDIFSVNIEIGFWVATPFQGHGIAKKAVRAIMKNAFAIDGINRIYANVFGENDASIAVLEGCGYELQGCFPESLIKNGKLSDCFVYASNKENWLEWDSQTPEFEILYFNRTY